MKEEKGGKEEKVGLELDEMNPIIGSLEKT